MNREHRFWENRLMNLILGIVIALIAGLFYLIKKWFT